MEEVGDLYIDVGEAYAENGEYSVCINENTGSRFLSKSFEQQVLSWDSRSLGMFLVTYCSFFLINFRVGHLEFAASYFQCSN